MDDRKPRYHPYDHPAGGWGAAAATAKALMKQSVLVKGSRALLSMNQPGGFKCPSCAFPDACHRELLEFCEQGAKALAFEATRHRVTRDFFARHTVSALREQSDYWLEMQGRLTEPMRYDPGTDRYVPISWDDAFALIGRHLRRLENRRQAEFYTSGRTPNEVAFLWSVFVREYGTNNFPDCSNMCHEPTSRGLPPSIGVGKGTCRLEDFDKTEAIFIFGQNTGSNSPRMMTNLAQARKRGIPIISINPMPERAMIAYTAPQNIPQMITFGHYDIASGFLHVKAGGDLAVMKGMMKAILEREAAGEDVLDRAFIDEYTLGIDAVRADAMAQDWAEIVETSGISEEQIRQFADIYIRSNATMICYGMGLTQHQRGSELLQQLCNILFLRGNFGKPGAGIVPVRGHSNVQGDRTCGINDRPRQQMLDNYERVFGFPVPREDGHNVQKAVEAMMTGEARIFIGMGGNFVRAVPDTERSYQAMSQLDLTVGINTKLNRGHVIHGREALILPVISRSEVIQTEKGEQALTIEDMVAQVTASRGTLEPASPDCMAEAEIVCRIAMATLPDSRTPWTEFAQDYALIRDYIADVFPEIYADFNERLKAPDGFFLDVPPRQRVFPTDTGKANFLVLDGLHADVPVDDPQMLRLLTVRSQDQFNTTIYSTNDRYRGVWGNRMVLFMNPEDREARGLQQEQVVGLETICDDGHKRMVSGLTVLDYPLPRGAVAGYYPELNPLLPIEFVDTLSGTPAAKSIPVRVIT
ncbi:FdhF/YdeP family oxidoreductase [Paracoccus sp. S1E-3]|uniref:FdhF/YdeP family oxidoreductase n=1 Tax=Paracoccus sp. S1E-3 TaxID=2756130 RepID=UPI0015EE719E|nr:FdhF/YdeP family oxidoreductase [Paracoccus sp. S1E-3]MBA4490491.1 FdhF/YdeP family oxidoreductase [Paracoccus sp. S1E-3]